MLKNKITILDVNNTRERMITNKDISTPLGAMYAYVKPRMKCRKMQNSSLRLGS